MMRSRETTLLTKWKYLTLHFKKRSMRFVVFDLRKIERNDLLVFRVNGRYRWKCFTHGHHRSDLHYNRIIHWKFHFCVQYFASNCRSHKKAYGVNVTQSLLLNFQNPKFSKKTIFRKKKFQTISQIVFYKECCINNALKQCDHMWTNILFFVST